jgi:hypothetical protein
MAGICPSSRSHSAAKGFVMSSKPYRSAAACAALLLALPATSLAAACPTGPLSQILAIGTCTIGDQTFDFLQPVLANKPVYFNGPFAGNTGLAPAASAITFTPNISAGGAGFTLAGAFGAFGAPLRFDPFSGQQKVGNFFDAVLGYMGVTPGSGKGLSGYSVSLGGAAVSAGTFGSYAVADLNSATAYLTDSGAAQLSNSVTYSQLVAVRQLYVSNIKTYEYSPNTADFAGFSSIQYSFSQQAIAPVPEPQQWALMLAGLALFSLWSRRRRPEQPST